MPHIVESINEELDGIIEGDMYTQEDINKHRFFEGILNSGIFDIIIYMLRKNLQEDNDDEDLALLLPQLLQEMSEYICEVSKKTRPIADSEVENKYLKALCEQSSAWKSVNKKASLRAKINVYLENWNQR